jgi:folate-dependent tRNA-U54 methylase TrmFO/GidA
VQQLAARVALENCVGLLKEELARLDSLIVTSAREAAVPAGGALAVDRERFSAIVDRGCGSRRPRDRARRVTGDSGRGS